MKINDLQESDTGLYECKIMVEQQVTVTHSLTVANIFSIQSDPADALVHVPLRGQTRFGCKVTGANDADIEWTRDGGKFSTTDSYKFNGDYIQLTDVTIQVNLTKLILFKKKLRI